MGRKMLKMERIANEKTRVTTYKKRKTCLLKKAKEFSTLCGVDVCLVIYGPTRTTRAATEEEAVAEPETWPTDRNKVHNIISKYRDTALSSCRKTFHTHDFLSERGQKLESNKTRGSSTRMKYRTWDEKLSELSKEELCGILGDIEDKIRKAQSLVSLLGDTKRQNRALAEANQQALSGYNYNHVEQQHLLPWPHLGLPVSYSHDPATMESIRTLMMISRHESYGLLPGLYGGPEAYIGPHWTQENIVLNGADQFASNWVFDPPLLQMTEASKWEEDSNTNPM